MIKISALNDESEEESGSEEEVTKEALEQIALQQYAKALELQRKGNLQDATQLLKDLLDTEVLYEVQKPVPGEKASSPLFNLKYLCYKNLASMMGSTDNFEGAIEAYCLASELDDTDVTLWHRLGLLCLRAKRYEMALDSFQRGIKINPRHWPCIDKAVTLLLGLDSKEECIATIYDALKLDPDYFRGLAYRKHIYSNFRYVRDFMEYLNPIYKWDETKEELIDEDNAQRLIKEAEDINESFLAQLRTEEYKFVLPELQLKKPISQLNWEAVGNSLVHMHHYMTENAYSHACKIIVLYEKENINEEMEVCEETAKVENQKEEPPDTKDNSKPEDNNTDTEKNAENGSENENNELSDKEKATTDTEKVESDVEIIPTEPASETTPETKRKARRRGSALSCLELWEWCTKRRSARKKPITSQPKDDNIYDMLRRMVPVSLVPEQVEKKENQRAPSPENVNLGELYDEKPQEVKVDGNKEYFGTESEQKDVECFIKKFTENKYDIIDILKNYLEILSAKWRIKWPESLSKVFVEANKCYSEHVETPSWNDENHEAIIFHTFVNILMEEFCVNERFTLNTEDEKFYDLSIIEQIGLTLSMNSNVFPGTDCMELILRYLWVKLHISLLNKSEEMGLDCLYQLAYEFDCMGEYKTTYTLNLVNFTFKPMINENEINEYIKFLERNKKLATVMELFNHEQYEEVLSIITDSYEHCKDMAKKQEDEMSLDFSVQLCLILDTYWALEKVEDCFKWSFICLHESLKHYFRYTSGSADYEKWTKTVVKVLFCIEHILNTEDLSCLDAVPRKDLSQGLEDLIRIIGHQVETTTSDMPFDSVVPWIIMHYILQREDDLGRGRTLSDGDKVACDEVPNPLMLLFIAHEQLGIRGWCSKQDGKLLFFTLDTVVPRLRSPALAKPLEQVCQHMEQCVFCLFGHPGKKNKLKYLADHNVTSFDLNWERAQQLYEIFRPLNLPELEGKVPAISADIESLFHRILKLLPPECDPSKYVTDVKKYIKGIENKLPAFPSVMPYKMRDIYFLLGDYYFKKEEGKMAVKYNTLDVVVNSDRVESWAEISLAKAVNLENLLNSCKNLNNEKEFLTPAKYIIRCFERVVELDPTHCNMWIEYGIFVYIVHSFCSRQLKQASESLSMEDYETLEKQKESMLDITQKCFVTVLEDHNNSVETDKSNEDAWLNYYMLGKVAEKRNKPPAEYLDFYMLSVKSLQETDATYPSKINYNTPTNLCIEVLELHYRIHASILKYIEQHENKPIPSSVGKIFLSCIEEWIKGPFSKKSKKDNTENESEVNVVETVQAANILKRSISDVGEEDTSEVKKLKLESAAAKVRRSASYDTERVTLNETDASIRPTSEITLSTPEPTKLSNDNTGDTVMKLHEDLPKSENEVKINENVVTQQACNKIDIKEPEKTDNISVENKQEDLQNKQKGIENKQESTEYKQQDSVKKPDDFKNKEDIENKQKGVEINEEDTKNNKKEETSSSSSSSSESSSSDSSSDSSSESSRDSETSNEAKQPEDKPLTDEDIMKIISYCIDALEDCASRFPQNYKAIYRLAHYHFYFKKGKDIERCRDLMLSTFTSRVGQKIGGLFSERKHSNFFNNIWKIPQVEVDRAGGFSFHMNRSVLLTMEILKEIDDHKTLLDLSMQLQRTPDPDKKYLRDCDREELAQQAFSLCVQSLKGQLTKFSQQSDLKSNEVERQALKSLMLDIYRAYQKVQKQPNSKQFTNLLIEAYKLITTVPLTENLNLVDISMKYCQSMIQTLKQQATQAILDKTAQKKNINKASSATINVAAETSKPITTTTQSSHSQSKTDHHQSKPSSVTATTSSSNIPKMSAYEMAAALQNYLPMMNDPVLTQQTAAALSLSYLSNMSALAGYSNSLQTSMQSLSLQNSFQAEFYRQFLSQTLNPGYNLPPAPKKQKRGPKPSLKVTPVTVSSAVTSTKSTKPFNVHVSSASSTTKATPTSVITSLTKSTSAPLTPSMGTVLQKLPPSMTATLAAYGTTTSRSLTTPHTSQSGPVQAHLATSTASTVNAAIHTKPPLPHQQTSPGKTLQEKLAERQKHSSSKTNINLGNITKLPSSLIITKTKTNHPQPKKLPFSKPQPKPISSDEVIVLDDDDD